MQHGLRPGWRRAGVTLAVIVALAIPAGAKKMHERQALAPTPADPHARGRARLALRTDSDGRFDVVGHQLDANATFEVLVAGVHVGRLGTNGHGNGKARFGSRPRGHDQLLGFDPRGAHVAVRNSDGQDVLEGDVPDDRDPDQVPCCVPNSQGGVDCQSRTEDACGQAGGTVSDADSCLPNPCQASGSTVICCTPGSAQGAFTGDDDPEVDCEELTQADCTAQGGTVVQADACDPNPCAPTPPPTNVIACCVTDDEESECRMLTPDGCTAHHGAPGATATCDPDPCSGSHHDGEGRTD